MLESWYDCRDHNVGRVVFSFLEQQFRLMIPVLVRREWSGERIEDVLRDLLLKVIEKPSPGVIKNPRAYFKRALRNRFIDLHRKRRRKNEHPIDEERWPHLYEDRVTPSALALIVTEERSSRLHSALEQLATADRVVLKLDFAPEWLTLAEQEWLATRTDRTVSSVQAAILAADGDTHALSLVNDASKDNPDDPLARRKRMERFRRRRARARKKLATILKGADL